MTPKFLVCVTGQMVVPLTKIGQSPIGTGLREENENNVLAM